MKTINNAEKRIKEAIEQLEKVVIYWELSYENDNEDLADIACEMCADEIDEWEEEFLIDEKIDEFVFRQGVYAIMQSYVLEIFEKRYGEIIRSGWVWDKTRNSEETKRLRLDIRRNFEEFSRYDID